MAPLGLKTNRLFPPVVVHMSNKHDEPGIDETRIAGSCSLFFKQLVELSLSNSNINSELDTRSSNKLLLSLTGTGNVMGGFVQYYLSNCKERKNIIRQIKHHLLQVVELTMSKSQQLHQLRFSPFPTFRLHLPISPNGNLTPRIALNSLTYMNYQPSIFPSDLYHKFPIMQVRPSSLLILLCIP